jgi:integrase/recombinase XerD
MIALKHIRRDIDRHGNVRLYLRVPGRRQVRLRQLPGSAAFVAEYQAALAAGEGGPVLKPADMPRGSLAATWAAWRAAPEFSDLAPRTKHVRALILAPLLAEHGAKPLAFLSARHVQVLRDARTPGAANGLLEILRQLLGWAVRHQLLERNVALDVPYLRPAKPGGFRAWTHADLETFRERWPVGTRARLALELLAQTGVRRSDVVRPGAAHGA